MFSQQHVFGHRRWWRKTTCRIDADDAESFVELKPRDWDGIVDALAALEARLRRDDATPPELLVDEWNRQSIEAIPPGVFIWLDDLETEYVRMFGRTLAATGQSEAPATADTDPTEADPVDADEIELATVQSNGRPGDGELSFSPLLTHDQMRTVFAGFDRIYEDTEPGTGGGPGHSHRLKNRTDLLDPLIRAGRQSALDPDDWQSVWDAMVRLAQQPDPPAPVVKFAEGEILYQDQDRISALTRDALRMRFRRARVRTRTNANER